MVDFGASLGDSYGTRSRESGSNRGVAWDRYPTIQTDGSGNVISTNDANWLFFKFGNENNTGTYYLNITLNKGGIDGQSRNSDAPLAVQVVDMKTAGAWLHNGTAAAATDFKRVTLNAFGASSSTTQVVSISRTETNTIDDDSNLVVDDEDYGPVGKTGDWRLAASAETTVDVYIQTNLQSGVGGNDFVMGHADQDIALGAADQSAPTSPTALTAPRLTARSRSTGTRRPTMSESPSTTSTGGWTPTRSSTRLPMSASTRPLQ